MSVAAQGLWGWEWVKQGREPTGGVRGDKHRAHTSTQAVWEKTEDGAKTRLAEAGAERRLKGRNTGGTMGQGLVGQILRPWPRQT